jgi:predicted NACHT family NTPase
MIEIHPLRIQERHKMSQEVDANRVTAELFAALAKDAAKALSGGLRDALHSIFNALRENISAYMSSTIDRCSFVKTILINRDRPTFFPKIYVHTILRGRSKSYTDDQLISNLPRVKTIIIEGSAGSGKSMFMRYLFLSLCEKPGGKVPLFVELRHLNNLQTKNLKTYILYSILNPGSQITQDQFDRGLRNGAFTLILDGLDEVDFDIRKDVESQIRELHQFSEIQLIVSSRPDPDNRFESWTRFFVYRIEPMTEKQTFALISKLEYDKDKKSNSWRL